MIRIKDLHKYYVDHHLFKGISLHFHRGEVVALIGPRGAERALF